MGRPLPTGALMKSKRSAFLYTVNLATCELWLIRLLDAYTQIGCLRSIHYTPSSYCQEMTEVMFSCPSYRIAPTSFGRLSNNTIIHFERKVVLCLQGSNGL